MIKIPSKKIIQPHNLVVVSFVPRAHPNIERLPPLSSRI